MTLDQSPGGLAALYAEIGRELAQPGSRTDALTALSRVALARIPGAEWASITEGRNGNFVTVTSTHATAREVDEIQYALGTGPCVDTILQDVTFRTGDLGNDNRWPEFAQKARDIHGVRSMLSFRLYLEDDPRIASLNIYSTKADAFHDNAEPIGTLVATHGALAVAAGTARDQATQLQSALVNSREIGMAMGVLMATHKFTREQAFDLLRIASQKTNRKLAEVATDVVDTGVLDLPGDTGKRNGRPRPGGGR